MIPIIKKPTIINKIWGKEIVIINDPKYCGKILEFKKNHFSSLHFHTEKTETWYILTGSIILSNENNHTTLNQGTVIHIEPKTLHKITALENTQILEVSTHHKDNDTTRISPSGTLN